jgi:hypothetical protein
MKQLDVKTGNWKCADMRPLAVVLASFTVKATPAGALAEWDASSVSLHGHYEVEKSADGKSFAVIGSTEANSFLDGKFTAPAYYRLVDVGLDGKRTAHWVVYLGHKIHRPYEVYTLAGLKVGDLDTLQGLDGLYIVNRKLRYLGK